MPSLEVGGSSLAVAPLSVRSPQTSLHALLGSQPLMVAPKVGFVLLVMVSYQPDQLPQQETCCILDVSTTVGIKPR